MSWWQYLTLVNIYLVLFYVFFSLLLKRETFFQLNRLYIVATTLFSFLIPAIQADWVKGLFITQKVKYMLFSNRMVIYSFKATPQQQHFTIGQILLIIYIGVALVLAVRLAWQFVRLKKILVQTVTPSAYSFFKMIRLGDDIRGREVIEAHEQVHARQWHSADVLLIEVLTIINWFNPIVYLYRRAIKHIHEFIADKQAVSHGIDKSEYAMLLLSQTFNTPAHQLVTPFFNHSLLKQRITMLQKRKSNRVALLKYAFFAPLFVLMLILSSATINNSNAFRIINRNAEQVFLIPANDAADADSLETDSVKINPDETHAELKRSQSQIHTYDNTFSKGTGNGMLMDTVPVTSKDKVFTAVDQSPEFPGGITEFYQFLGRTIRYPAEMRRNNIQGRVIITFVVEKDGSLSNIVVLRSPGYGSAEESARVMALCPKWHPGMQNGKPVRVQYTVPISFTLAGTAPNKKKDTTQKTGMLKLSPVIKMDNLTLSSDTAKHRPIYILNGKEVNHDILTMLNPKDIESINVLKDKSAAAIYGQKGTYGVIVITTKNAPALLPANK